VPSAARIARRTLLIGTAALAGGLAVGYYSYRKPYANPLEDDLTEGESTFNPYVKVGADNTVTIVVPRAEMGQGVTTTLAALVAEELDLDLDVVVVEHGPASHAYYNEAMLEEGGPFPFFEEGMVAGTVRAVSGAAAKMLGVQGTGGSSSTRDAFDKMRRAGAAARHVLIAAAAKETGLPAGEFETDAGRITHRSSGRSLTFGDVAGAAAVFEPPVDLALKPTSQWKLLGKSQDRTDMLAKATGAPIFAVDVKLAGHAVRYRQDEPALLVHDRQRRYFEGRRDSRRGQDRAPGQHLWPRFRDHRREYLGSLQGGGRHRGAMERT
jgi:isoquinoline 1-oxidoreductase beta subunit